MHLDVIQLCSAMCSVNITHKPKRCSLGNELNAGNGPATTSYGNCASQVYLLIGEMAKEIKKIDPDHLVTTAFEIGTSNKPGSIPATTLIAQAASNGLLNLDFWGMDLYCLVVSRVNVR